MPHFSPLYVLKTKTKSVITTDIEYFRTRKAEEEEEESFRRNKNKVNITPENKSGPCNLVLCHYYCHLFLTRIQALVIP